jgi:hypothetical protein
MRCDIPTVAWSIDLSGVEHAAKFDYIRSVLPALNVMRRRMGTPHRIIVDEGHYFLRNAVDQGLLDLVFNGYTVVTYWPSQLPEQPVAATEVILVTRESNPNEIDSLREHCQACQHVSPSSWEALPNLHLDHASALPVTVEAGSELLAFTIGERLTPHVRHRQKYVDVPVRDDRAFVFRVSRAATVIRAHTVREFVAVSESLEMGAADGYLRRGDFLRWISDASEITLSRASSEATSGHMFTRSGRTRRAVTRRGGHHVEVRARGGK